jgi:hypothetical protein
MFENDLKKLSKNIPPHPLDNLFFELGSRREIKMDDLLIFFLFKNLRPHPPQFFLATWIRGPSQKLALGSRLG